MSSIVDSIKTIWEKISNIPSLVFNQFKDLLNGIATSISNLPKTIIDGIKDIFVPDTEEIETKMDSAITTIQSRFGFQDFHLDSLANSSSAPTDITGNIKIGNSNIKATFFNTKYLIDGVNYFRPFIRGFVVLLLLFYNYKMFLGFIGHSIGVAPKGDDKE